MVSAFSRSPRFERDSAGMTAFFTGIAPEKLGMRPKDSRCFPCYHPRPDSKTDRNPFSRIPLYYGGAYAASPYYGAYAASPYYGAYGAHGAGYGAYASPYSYYGGRAAYGPLLIRSELRPRQHSR